MAKKKVTAANTGLSASRSTNKFAVSWKHKAKNIKKQSIRYRTYNGKKWSSWTTVTLSAKATSYSKSFSASAAITKIQFQTTVKADGRTASAWASSSYTYEVSKPHAPSLTTTPDSPNRTTFAITSNAKADDHCWEYRLMYRTRLTAETGATTGWSGWAACGASYTYTETDQYKYREFQVKAVGPGGESGIVTGRHYIGSSPSSTWGTVTFSEQTSYYHMLYTANVSGNAYTVDTIVPQYYIGTPNASMQPPESGWTDANEYNFAPGKSKYDMVVTTESLLSDDQCLWARIKTIHDGIESKGAAKLVKAGSLIAPTATISMGTPTTSGFTVTITMDDWGTSVPGVYAEVYLEKRSSPGQLIKIGEVANGQSSAAITSTENITSESGYAIYVRNISADGQSMTSPYYIYSTSMPNRPTDVTIEPTTTKGKVYVEWTNNWADATGAVIAWTDDRDNWMSNEEPETFEISERVTNWFITGLETGKTWYFRVRAVKKSGDQETLSPWSEDTAIDLTSAPAIPVLYLSDTVITVDGMTTAYWSYVSTDGTDQISAAVVEGTIDSQGAFIPGDVVGSTTSDQHIDIYAADAGWETGDVVYLALQTGSGSGGLSDYSTPVQLAIAERPTVGTLTLPFDMGRTLKEYFISDGSGQVEVTHNINSLSRVLVDGVQVQATASGSTVTLTAEEGAEIEVRYSTNEWVLRALPATFSTSQQHLEATIIIERAEDYTMKRPNGKTTVGHAGETVYVGTMENGTVTITRESLIGRLDDGAKYRVIITVTDEYGQSASSEWLFTVAWFHQAWIPEVNVTLDTDEYYATITPVSTSSYLTGDTADIYRLSEDGEELIYSGATFGEAYIDPYPAFGPSSGYKVVTITKDMDYITPDNEIAEAEALDYTPLDPGSIVIDFGGDRVELPYNITLDNTWAKDFERTVYMNGSVIGDHNAGVTRDLSAGTVIARNVDEETAIKMRELANFAGTVHVRTPEGSSFEADVEVQGGRSHDSGLISYSLSIAKVDTTGFDAMTQAEWDYYNELE